MYLLLFFHLQLQYDIHVSSHDMLLVRSAHHNI